jgi:hypothetical protein
MPVIAPEAHLEYIFTGFEPTAPLFTNRYRDTDVGRFATISRVVVFLPGLLKPIEKGT